MYEREEEGEDGEVVVDVYEDDGGGEVYAEAEDLVEYELYDQMEMGMGLAYRWHLGVPVHVGFVVID